MTPNETKSMSAHGGPTVRLRSMGVLALLLCSTVLSFPVSAQASQQPLLAVPCRGAVVLSEAADDPIDHLLFFGESTTAHLKTTGVLSGGKNTAQVLAPAGNTMMLSPKTAEMRLLDPVNGGECTLREFVAREKPRTLVLSFGLNGIVAFAAQPERYLADYRRLCDAVLEASPETEILLQSIYPVSRAPRDWSFSKSPTEINRDAAILNQHLATFAEKNAPHLCYVNTAAVLTDADGFLPDADTTDGIHLTPAAYQKILACLRAHCSSKNNQTKESVL